MAKKKRSVGSLRGELVSKSREAALSAIRVFNDPMTKFKSESFIVLMTIAWTYMLHAYYRSKNIEYRYYEQKAKRRKFDRTKRGAFKYWELERCLNEGKSPIDKDAATNLRFLIGLRHEIEHQMTRQLDNYLSARYQACALNYNEYLKKLFGKKQGIEDHLTYSIQFLQLADEQITGPMPAVDIPPRLLSYITEFDNALNHEEFNSPKYAYRLLFHKKLVNQAGQADRVIEFLDPKSDAAKAIDKEFCSDGKLWAFIGDGFSASGVGVFLSVTKRSLVRFRPIAPYNYDWGNLALRGPASSKGGVGVLGYFNNDAQPFLDRRGFLWTDAQVPPNSGNGSGSGHLADRLWGDVLLLMEAGNTYLLWTWIWGMGRMSAQEDRLSLSLAQISCRVPAIVVDAGPVPVIR